MAGADNPSRGTTDGPALSRRWSIFSTSFVVASLAALFALIAVLVVLDPYDAGRFGLPKTRGVPEQGPRTANASRGRDPAFNAAIIGNSHIQLIAPERLKTLTGFDFVSLSVPATRPREQFAVLNWFLRHHPAPDAIVFGLDDTWCLDSFINDKPFPFWLYGDGTPAFLRGLFSFAALEKVQGRIALATGKAKPARRDGYWDYEVNYRAIGYGDADFVRGKLAGDPPSISLNPRHVFPAAERFGAVLAKLPPAVPVVLVWPPVFIGGQPAPGSEAEAAQRACKRIYADLAAARRPAAVVDWARDLPENHGVGNFFDRTHYRHPLARLVERDIAAALAAMRPVAR